MSGFIETGTLAGDPVLPGDDRVIRTTGRFTASVSFSMADVNPAMWWVIFGLIRPDLLHDACWDGEAIR